MLVSVLPAFAANSAKKLPPNYRHWLEVEVPYIITSDERKQFLALNTDEQRESFINAFWRIRNPDPVSELNTYKEEHYRRLSYANEHFGSARYEDGWRTEMGRIYIVLGPPKQRAPYHEKANVRPMEIWFYQADTPVLPPHFYILFYKHSAAEDWKIYSPRMDGPVELVTTGESQNDNRLALSLLRKSLGDEVAKVACTLIPGERADFDDFRPSMESDMLIASINGLADNPMTKERLEANRLREHVTSSVLVGDQDLSLTYDVVRDEKGRETLSYLLRTTHPDARMIGSRADGKLYYDLTLRTSITTTDGKQVYDQEDQLTGNLSEAQADLAKKKRFGAEARLPLAPGTYVVDAMLTNNINHIASKKRMTLTVPAVKSDELGLSPLLAYAAPAAVPDAKERLPFSISRLRFTPRGAQVVELRQGDELPLVFQLWLGSNSADAPQANQVQSQGQNRVHLRYVFGTVTASHENPTEEKEDIDAGNHDQAGNLLTGHKLNTSSLDPGTYRLVVSATRDSDHRTAYAAINLRVLPVTDYIDLWTAYGPADPGGEAVDDLKRGLSAEAQGADVLAQTFYTDALADGSTDLRPLDQLAALLSRRGMTDELGKLSQQPILATSAASPKTLLLIARAVRDRGNPKEAVKLLEKQIKLQPPNADLYHSLADACEAAGDPGRARDLRALASNLRN